jgi:voltage-gated sodium channel
VVRCARRRVTAVTAGLQQATRTTLYREKRQRAALRRARAANEQHEFYGCWGSERHHEVVVYLREMKEKAWYQVSVVVMIAVASILVGVQLYEHNVNPHGVPEPGLSAAAVQAVVVMNWIVLVLFTLELLLGIASEGRFFWRFFVDPWNWLDIAVVVLGFAPLDSRATTPVRLLRILRILRLVRALPQLHMLVQGLVGSVTSIIYIWVLLLMLFYLYAVVGVVLFRENDAFHFGQLHRSFLTLFGLVTLEDWADVFYTAYYGCAEYPSEGESAAGPNVAPEMICFKSEPQPVASVLFFFSFILLGSMVVLNLFIGVISSSITQAQRAMMAEFASGRVLAAEANEASTVHEASDAVVETKLEELSELMSRITDEVEQFRALEKARKAMDLAERIRDAHTRGVGGFFKGMLGKDGGAAGAALKQKLARAMQNAARFKTAGVEGASVDGAQQAAWDSHRSGSSALTGSAAPNPVHDLHTRRTDGTETVTDSDAGGDHRGAGPRAAGTAPPPPPRASRRRSSGVDDLDLANDPDLTLPPPTPTNRRP